MSTWAIALFAGQIMFSDGPHNLSLEECENVYVTESRSLFNQMAEANNLNVDALELLGLVEFTCVESETDPMDNFLMPDVDLEDVI